MIQLADERDLYPFGDVMTVEEFKECVDCGGFIDYDGNGYFVTGGDGKKRMWRSPTVYPSEVKSDFLEACQKASITHVIWFNK